MEKSDCTSTRRYVITPTWPFFHPPLVVVHSFTSLFSSSHPPKIYTPPLIAFKMGGAGTFCRPAHSQKLISGWLFLFAVLMAAVLLFTMVFFVSRVMAAMDGT